MIIHIFSDFLFVSIVQFMCAVFSVCSDLISYLKRLDESSGKNFMQILAGLEASSAVL
jgi:hypothetical protein